MGPPSGDAFDKSSTSCTNLQNSDAEQGTRLLLSHPVNSRWGIVRPGTPCNIRLIVFGKQNVYFYICLRQVNVFYHFELTCVWFDMEIYVRVLVRSKLCDFRRAILTTHQNEYIYFHIKPLTCLLHRHYSDKKLNNT